MPYKLSEKEREEFIDILTAYAETIVHRGKSPDFPQTDGTDIQSYVESLISKKVEEAVEERNGQLIELVVRHIENNWYASLGWGEDRKVYKNALEDLKWITEPLGITLDDLMAKKYLS